MTAPPEVKRRCQRRHCPHWIVLDPFDPEHTKQRYCSAACEERDILEAAHNGQLDRADAIWLALLRLRVVLEAPGRLSAALQTQPLRKQRTRFEWLDCVAHSRGELITVPNADTEAVMQALIAELNEWRKSGQRKAKGAVA